MGSELTWVEHRLDNRSKAKQLTLLGIPSAQTNVKLQESYSAILLVDNPAPKKPGSPAAPASARSVTE